MIACKCLEKVKEKLQREYPIQANIELCLTPTIDLSTGKVTPDLPPLYFTFREGKKRKRAYVTFNFCPFCGKRGES